MEEPFVSCDTCLQITSQGENVVELTWQQEKGNTNCEESEQKPRSRAIKWGAPSFLHAKNSQLFCPLRNASSLKSSFTARNALSHAKEEEIAIWQEKCHLKTRNTALCKIIFPAFSQKKKKYWRAARQIGGIEWRSIRRTVNVDAEALLHLLISLCN